MKKTDLHNAFPPMDQGFERAANRAFGQIREEQNMKHKRKFSLALAMLLVLVLAGSALAVGAVSRMRSQLQEIGATGAVEAVQDVNQVYSVGGCTVTVKETLVEGANAYITLGIATPDDQPMLLAAWENHDQVVSDDTFLPDQLMYMVGGDYADEYMVHIQSLDGMALADMQLNIELALAKPAADIVKVTDGRAWDDLVNRRDDVTTDEGLYVLDIDGYSLNGYASVRAWTGEWYEGSSAERADAMLNALQTGGAVEAPVRLTANAALKASDSGAYMRTDAVQKEFTMDGYRVIVDEVLAGELEISVFFRIIADRPMEEMDMDNDDPLWRGYEIFDAKSGARLYASSSGTTDVDADGNVYYRARVHARGVGAHSDRLTLAPIVYVPDENGEYNTLEGKARVDYVMDEAFVLELIP